MRRRLLVLMVAALAVPFVVAPVAHAEGEDESLTGYIGTASGAIFSFQPIFPGLLPTGDAPFEITGGLTTANVKSGGVAFGQSELVWPGSAAANMGPLLGQAAGQPIFYQLPAYPLGVQASQDDDAISQGVTPGPVVKASGKDGRSHSVAQAGGGGVPGIFTFASVSSSSRAAVENGELVSESIVVLHEVVLGAGDVIMESIKSVSRATSKGSSSTSTGSTVVSGLKIRGQGAQIDSEGMKGAGPLKEGLDEALKAAGIQLVVADGSGGSAGGSADRLSAGVLATIANPAASANPQFVGSRFVIALAPTAVGVKASPPFDAASFDDSSFAGSFDSGSGGSFGDISSSIGEAYTPSGDASSGGGGRSGLPAVFEPIRKLLPDVGGVPGSMVLALVAVVFFGSRWLSRFAGRFVPTEE